MPNPLVVDLDGTLIHTDTLHELMVSLVRFKPWLLLFIPFWSLHGIAYLKRALAGNLNVDVTSLPFNWSLINWLLVQKKLGRQLILCTATDLSIARNVASHIDIFDEVMGSDGIFNLSGKNKAHILVEKFGVNGFDYAGNSPADLAVWIKSRRGVVVNASNSLLVKAQLVTEVENVLPKAKNNLKIWLKLFRLHQWIKNLLIFVPLFAAT
jgi:hypothetical protein